MLAKRNPALDGGLTLYDWRRDTFPSNLDQIPMRRPAPALSIGIPSTLIIAPMSILIADEDPRDHLRGTPLI